MPIEQHSPGLERLVDVRQEIEELASGFGGPSGPAEGPVWWQDGGYLLFGTHLGTIATGAQTTNVAWGDDDWSTLYFTTWQTLGRLHMKIPGIPVPHRR